MDREEELYRVLLEAKDKYYNSDTPKMSDAQFDSYEDELRELNPNHEYFKIVGSEDVKLGKIVHPEPMLSMGKAKTAEDANKWFKKLDLPGIEYCLQPKIDGLAATCKYNNGRLVYVATRGDGKIGQDISHIAKYVDDIKEGITFSLGEVEVRGELYLPKNTEYDTKGKALRNNCVGLINRKENRADLKYVRFVCYQISGDHNITLESKKIETLAKDGFNVVDFSVLKTGSDIGNYYKEYLKSKRVVWEYETDGIILTVNDNTKHQEIDSRWVVDHHHHYNLAIKPPSEGKETKLLGIDWQVSRQGSIIPVAMFEPIDIGGAKLERATLHNYDNVVSLKLKKGDILYVERANDVIPYVKENRSNINREEDFLSNLIPKNCPSCGEDLDRNGVHIKCNNTDCKEILIQQIIYWVKESDIDGVAEGTLRALYKEGKVKHIKDLYHLKYEDLFGLEGFGDKKINGFINGVKNSKTVTAIKLLSRLGIPLVQEKALMKLNIKSIDDFLVFNDETFVTGQNIVKWKKDRVNLTFLEELIESLDIIKTEDVESRGFICMTGKGPKSRKEIIEIIESKGWSFSSTISKDVDILLCEDPEGSSSKLIKAKKLGIKLLSYSDFIE
ncbi:BRCT domain-containing protein [Thiospirochaeta perfilievii]|nr:BRCT domain-containing protein [Thiospirochaeta perfilievii]